MRKYLFICLLALAACMGSCTYPTYHNTYITEDSKFNKKTVDLVVAQDKWTFDETVNQFYCHFDVEELTEQVYNYGEVSVSHEYNSGKNNAYQVALPETTYKMEEDVDTDGKPTGNKFYYQQHLDYAYGVGFVEVFCTISDFYYEEGWTPDPMLFRLQMSY